MLQSYGVSAACWHGGSSARSNHGAGVSAGISEKKQWRGGEISARWPASLNGAGNISGMKAVKKLSIKGISNRRAGVSAAEEGSLNDGARVSA